LQYLQFTVISHEESSLQQSFHILQHAIDADPLNPLPLFLRGVYLRHGWGCETNHKDSYDYLLRALSSAFKQFTSHLRLGGDLTIHRSPIAPMGEAFNSVKNYGTLPPTSPLGVTNSNVFLKQPMEAKKYRGSNLPTPPFDSSGPKSMISLILFEISSSLKFGWGVKKDAEMAKYLMCLAANMGDTDACVAMGMNAMKHGQKRMAAKYLRWASFGAYLLFLVTPLV
jgi:hypothetical protein